MKINNVGMNNVNPYQRNQQKVDATQQTTKAATDKIEISSAAKQLSEITTYASERAEKVQQLKADIEAGTYKVDANKVAKDLINFYKG